MHQKQKVSTWHIVNVQAGLIGELLFLLLLTTSALADLLHSRNQAKAFEPTPVEYDRE